MVKSLKCQRKQIIHVLWYFIARCSTKLQETRGLTCDQTYVLFCVGEDWTRRRSCARILELHKQMLQRTLVIDSRWDSAICLRFSPVWLYMCVCSELGLVNLLSQTLHLCFFCVFEDTLELNDPIIDCGAGGMLEFTRPEGRGRVREVIGSRDSEAEL
jgi:hypothetical protein